MKQNALTKGNFIEKIVRNQDGRLVRATFCLYEYNGRLKARVVSFVYLEEKAEIAQNHLVLCGLCVENTFNTAISFERPVASPYFNKNILYSSGSKPRAPTIY